MARGINIEGKEYYTELRDLKRGDTVCVSWYGCKYYKVKVTRVKIVECAVIITVEKVDLFPKRFVGYYTGKIATSDNRGVLTLDNYWGDQIEQCLESSEMRSDTICKRAKALRGLKDIKEWLNHKESYADREVE